MTDVKLSAAVTRYDGSEDVETWLHKFNTVADLKGLDALAKAKNMAMLLDGDAFDVYTSLDRESRGDPMKVSKALRQAFGRGLLTYADTICDRDSIDAADDVDPFLARVKRCQEALGGTDTEFEQRLRAARLIRALPMDVGDLVGTVCGKKLVLTDVAEIAKEKLRSRAAVRIAGVSAAVASRQKQLSDNRSVQNIECSACGAGGHVATECRGTVRCRNCRQSGHVARRCPKNGQAGSPLVSGGPSTQ